MLQQERNLRKTVAAHLATTGCTGCDQCARIRMLLGVIDSLRAALTSPADARDVPVAWRVVCADGESRHEVYDSGHNERIAITTEQRYATNTAALIDSDGNENCGPHRIEPLFTAPPESGVREAVEAERDEWKRVASEQAAMHDAAERERDLLRAALEELLDEVDDVWLEETPGMRSGRTALQGESEFEGKGTA